jgi:hypothetical protein
MRFAQLAATVQDFATPLPVGSTTAARSWDRILMLAARPTASSPRRSTNRVPSRKNELTPTDTLLSARRCPAGDGKLSLLHPDRALPLPGLLFKTEAWSLCLGVTSNGPKSEPGRVCQFAMVSAARIKWYTQRGLRLSQDLFRPAVTFRRERAVTVRRRSCRK